MWLKLVPSILLLVVYLQNALAAKILAICVNPSPSHSLWCYQYMSLLAARGHQITVLGVDEPKKDIPNLKTYVVQNAYEKLNAEMVHSLTTPTMTGYAEWNRINTKNVLKSAALKNLMSQHTAEKPFDLIIFDDTSCFPLLGLVHKFGNPPLLMATTYGSPQWTTFRMGNIFNPAYVPSMIAPFNQQMTFFERCENLMDYLLLTYYYNCMLGPLNRDLMKEVFGEDTPSGVEIAKRANVAIVNHHPALHDPRPLLPGVVGVAGLHIPDQPQPLPQDLKESLDNAKDGAILLSFGTNVNSSWLPQDIENIILKALEKFPQKVYWKWDREIPNVPKNVKISKWLPQGDMLGHPNMRLFISHCGLLSTQEAIYHKIPILAMPVFLDQIDNAAMLVRRNLTVQLNVYELTTQQLYDGIREILTNPMYKRNMQKLGELMRDMPQTSSEQAVFWTEYVIRHQGAPHLRAAAADMPWYQLLMLDILALALIIVVTTLWLLSKCIKCVISTCTGSSKKKKD